MKKEENNRDNEDREFLGPSRDNALVKRNIFLMKNKVFLDKVGAGFSSVQFLNILFSFTGASLFLIGLINALKSVLSTTTSSVVRRECRKGKFSVDLMLLGGLFFGFSFLIMAFAVSTSSAWLFAVSFLVSSIFFVIHGDMFQYLVEKYLGNSRQAIFREKTTIIGIFVMALTLFLSAMLIDLIPFSGKYFTAPIFGTLQYFGYLISFEIASFAFIFSAYFTMKMDIDTNLIKHRDPLIKKEYFKDIFANSKKYFKNKYLFMLTVATVFVGAFQAIMNAYLGIYVYREFFDYGLGGFLNVGLMLAVALIVVMLGPIISGRMSKNMGVVPLFVFGTLLMALLPLVIIYNPYFPAIVVANMLSVLGASMIGAGHNLVAMRILNENDRVIYYTSSGMFIIIPFLAISIFLSFIAQRAGLIEVFRYIGFGMVAILIPIYFTIVLWISKK